MKHPHTLNQTVRSSDLLKEDDVELLKHWVHRGLCLSEPLMDGTPLLFAACCHEEPRPQIIDWLLEQKVDVNAQNTAGENLLVTLCFMDDEDKRYNIIAKLIQAGIEVNTCGQYTNSPLMMAAFQGKTKTVSLLIQSGANFHRADDEGFTALMLACVFGHNDVVQILLNAGADSSLINHHGQSAMDIALENGQAHTVQLFLAYEQQKRLNDVLEDEIPASGILPRSRL